MKPWTIHTGDALETLRTMEAESFDAVLCDPPYGLGNHPDAMAMLQAWMTGEPYRPKGKGGFMGKEWDAFVPGPEYWREVMRVLKPGAFALVFAGTRTMDVMGLALRIAGLELRDTVSWVYGSGFPKSMDLGKAVAGAAREGAPGVDWSGYGTALKPAWEPCIVAMKPLDGTFAENAIRHGVAGINVEAGRIGNGEDRTLGGSSGGVASGVLEDGFHSERMERPEGGRWPANLILDEAAGQALDLQTGALKSGANPTRRVTAKFKNAFGEFQGRTECIAHRGADSGGASRFFYCAKASRKERDTGLDAVPVGTMARSNGAQRMEDDGENLDRHETSNGLNTTARVRNTHPCLKPLDLNRYLASLILPPKRDTPRRILTPFSGSGSEMIGALMAGWDEAVGIEREAEYVAIAEARLTHWVKAGPDELVEDWPAMPAPIQGFHARSLFEEVV